MVHSDKDNNMADDQTVDECGICLEKLTAAVTLPCKHKFCADCLDGWNQSLVLLLKSKKKRVNLVLCAERKSHRQKIC